MDLIVSDDVLTQTSKSAIIEYCRDDTVHSVLNITFKELLVSVWNRIISNDHSSEIKKVLDTEMTDSICKCFTGRVSRLINCLNGFDDLVEIKIHSSEQIANIIQIVKEELMSKKDEYTIELHRQIVSERLTEMGYEKEVIELWIEHIE